MYAWYRHFFFFYVYKSSYDEDYIRKSEGLNINHSHQWSKYDIIER